MSDRLSRRRFAVLAATTTTAALAGCSGDEDPGNGDVSGDQNGTDDATGTGTPLEGEAPST